MVTSRLLNYERLKNKLTKEVEIYISLDLSTLRQQKLLKLHSNSNMINHPIIINSRWTTISSKIFLIMHKMEIVGRIRLAKPTKITMSLKISTTITKSKTMDRRISIKTHNKSKSGSRTPTNKTGSRLIINNRIRQNTSIL